MRKIEDIRPAKKKKERIEPQIEAQMTADEFLAEAPALPEPDPEPLEYRPSKAKVSHRAFGQIIFGLLIFITASILCVISLIEVKNKITKNFVGLNSNFSTFSDSISDKNLPALAASIYEIDDKTSENLLLLQATGQDIYSLNLLYPKQQSSKVTTEVDLLRASHLLTASYTRLVSGKKANIFAFASGDNYLDKLNLYLRKASNFLVAFPSNLQYAQEYSKSAKAITDSANEADFSGLELEALKNLGKLSDLSGSFFAYLEQTYPDLESEFGLSGKKSYLVLFQNNAELRFGGGFIGSFARLDLENGRATSLNFEKNIYTLDKAYQATPHSDPAPPEFNTSSVTMRDSNFYPDFSESAKNVIELYKKESGNQVDGLIAIDTTFFRDLLKITGPINMADYNLTITDENFLTDVQYQVEIAYFQSAENKQENQPKKILADLMPMLINKLTSSADSEKKLSSAISEAISEKHLTYYSNNSKIEELVDAINAGGKIHQPSGDYLYIANSNIGGGKSSLNIAETVNQDIDINSSGKVSESLSVVRTHNGSYEWPDTVNRNFTKVFLPLSSKILSVENTGQNETIGENKNGVANNGKLVVSYWQSTAPGESSNSTVNYERQINLGNTFEYPITIQKQPGEECFEWKLSLSYPEGWKPENVDGYDAQNRIIRLSETILRDSNFTLRFIRD